VLPGAIIKGSPSLDQVFLVDFQRDDRTKVATVHHVSLLQYGQLFLLCRGPPTTNETKNEDTDNDEHGSHTADDGPDHGHVDAVV